MVSNTQERKPVTNSRDTQELLPEAGQEMLRIFHSHPARTSLLQDFAFYEVREFVCAFSLAFMLRAASSDAEDTGASTAATTTTATRWNSNHIRQYYPTIAFPSPAADHVLDGKHEHSEHSSYVRNNVASHGWRFTSALALHAAGHGHDEPAVWYAADPSYAPECPASP